MGERGGGLRRVPLHTRTDIFKVCFTLSTPNAEYDAEKGFSFSDLS